MSTAANNFYINTYSYKLDRSALDCVNSLSEQGYRGIELMMYPGHLWPAEIDAAGRRELRMAAERAGLRIVSINMPNIDINIAGATKEMRAYTLGLLTNFVELAGDLGAPWVILGPGKANPLFMPPKETLLGHLYAGLDRLCPVAKAVGTKLLLENMPFAFLPTAQELLSAIGHYGNPDIGIIYDVANGHFIGKDPCEELRSVKHLVELIHFSDTSRKLYKHDPVGMGDVPFASVPPVMAEIGYKELPVLEIISRDPDTEIAESARRLAALGGSPASRAHHG
ncbi:MAG: sugar phosphate isomerase/epimerase family protein [Candidatus Korobacteraceae bacterium]|jgi:sugar phosphate isomerase/epimerase